MIRKHSFAYITSFIAVLVVLACVTTPVIPTLIPTQQPVSTSNPDMFSTMVANAAGAFMTQTAEAAPLPSPTPDAPLPTETPPPVATDTPVTSLADRKSVV